jgi:IS5 family transposase
MQKSFSTQPELFVTASDLDNQILSSLDDTEALLDWSKIESLLTSIYSADTGRPSYPLLTLFRSLLLGIWYKLSDVQLAQSLYRDLLFRKFCHLELTSDVPEASTLGRFRNKLVELNLWDSLLAEINAQLEFQNIIMTEGRINIIDATPIEAARSGSGNGKNGKPKKDPDAGWHVKKDSRGRQKSTYGYSVHTGVDEDGFIHSQSVTPGNVHDSQERDALILGDEAKLYADAAYSSKDTRDKLDELDIEDQVQRKGYRNNPLTEEDKTRNAEISVTRGGGERPFATYKQHYGLARTRVMGLAKNTTFYGLAAMAANIRKGAKFLMLYGLPEIEITG